MDSFGKSREHGATVMRLPDMMLRLRQLKGKMAATLQRAGSGQGILPLPSGPPFVKGDYASYIGYESLDRVQGFPNRQQH